MSLFGVPGASAWRQPSNPSTIRIVYTVAARERFVRVLGGFGCFVIIAVLLIRMRLITQCKNRSDTLIWSETIIYWYC